MKKFNQPKLLLAVLCSAIAFNAHASFWDGLWGKNTGDDGNPNTVGNAGARQAKANAIQPQVAKLKVGVVNNTNSILASAVLKDKTGKVLYTSTKGKTCAAGAVCWLGVARNLVVKGNTFFFYDNKNQLVAAYMADNVPAKAPLYNIGASMDDLGVYVLSKIRLVNPKITYNRVDNDIVTTSLNATPYQELADYYLDLMGNAKDNTPQETKVINALITQFAKNKSIPANSDSQRLTKNQPARVKNSQLATKKVALKSSPSVRSEPPGENQDSPLCAESLRTAMDGLSMIPMIGDVIKVAATTARDASCPSGDADIKDYMANQFSRVNVGLGEIKKQLTGLENQLKAFEQTYNKDKLSEQKNKVDELDNQFNIWLTQYQSALLTSRGPNGQQYNSLTDLVNSFGSVNKAIAKNPDLKGFLDTLYDDNSEYQAMVDLGLSSHFTTSKVDQVCGNANNIAGDVFEIRSACNAVIIAMYSKNIILEKQMSYAYNDIKKVYDMDARSDKKRLLTIPADDFTNWVTNIEQMNPKTAIVRPIKDGEPVYTVANNLMGKGFKVTAWYAEADKRYLEVIYGRGGYNPGNEIKSKYAYQQPTRDSGQVSYASNAEIDSNFVNVMGVPVPERFFTAKDSNGVVKDRNNYGAVEAFPWADATLIAGTKKLEWYDFAIADFKNSSGNLVIHSGGFTPSLDGTLANPNNGTTSQENYEGAYERQIFAKTAPDLYRVKYYIAREHYVITNGNYFTYMRYTAADGNSYVWAMRTWVEIYSDAAQVRPIYAAPQCMTNDCTVDNTGVKLDKLLFPSSNINFTWNYEGPLDHMVYTLKEAK